ncbi:MULTISPECIES: RNA polymerase sigma factor [Bacteroidota]|jgi:RNA polymerase sigma-70 factor (ECF subfamily)|uniref:RNA polymerase sigma factor n=2 Tax=Flectobacillus TaxID=101 RepID=A0ABT6Z450_9BACT|nr:MULTISPECIES: RNA polymerase sigma factor [Bacteroidota]NBA76608.1 sigma-70 family RNA polymerase sigma factor [Emticicia sp. ODNR4P]MDI9861020.1 RNA polymerase sigma factor [Flectobacillus roseus]MDI9870207.1 RNA polymerase sigma factor [Flectobacillus roseus]MDI9875893.1 RNA polymerase sigma factor [Flectobacillus rivi]NBB27713.1 sigma-70 family RNA polymerase sigma factor [Cellulophaga sp. BC115SP]
MKANLKKETDEKLVKLFIETQKNIYFEHLYDRYSDKVYRKCLSFVKDEARAEDFAHDIFLKLVMNISSYKETAKFSTWLYSITYNYCIDQTRLAKRYSETLMDENFDVEDYDEGAELAEMEATKLRKALSQMQPEEKSILMMKYQDDLSIKEISSTLDISESAVKMRLLRAKEKIRKVYLESTLIWGIIIAKALSLLFGND